MTDQFATTEQLTARLSSSYAVPADATKLLVKASELIDYATMGWAQRAFDDDSDTDDANAKIAGLADATCDQVEYWLEVGEEHDVVGLRGSLQGGRVQVQRMPGYLGQRTLRTLIRLGIYYGGITAR